MGLFGRRRGPQSERRRSMSWVMGAWAFGAAWMYIITGAAVTQFAKKLEMPPFGFGLLAALPFAGALCQLPVSYFTERYGWRKGFFVITGVIHRGLWLLVAVVPWIMPRQSAWLGFLLGVGLSWFVGQLVAPVWVSWMADLVPQRIRGRYFSRRAQLGQAVGILVTITVGYLLDQSRGDLTMLKTIAVAFAIAGLYGVIDFLLFLPVAEMRHRQPDPGVSLGQLLREPLADINFRRYLAYAAVLTVSAGFMGQFAWLYVLDVARKSNLQAQMLLIVVPLLIFVVMYPVWGKLVDRLGRKPVMLIAAVMIMPGSVGWIFVTDQHWVWAYLVIAVSTAAWPGLEIANFNFLLDLVDPAREGQRRTSGYVAISSAVGACAGILSGLFAGAVAQALKHWEGSLLGWPLTYHGVLFLVSGALRIIVVLLVTRIEDVKAQTTRAALRYMGTNLYSNLQQAIYLPSRLLMTRRRWTYRLGNHSTKRQDQP